MHKHDYYIIYYITQKISRKYNQQLYMDLKHF